MASSWVCQNIGIPPILAINQSLLTGKLRINHWLQGFSSIFREPHIAPKHHPFSDGRRSMYWPPVNLFFRCRKAMGKPWGNDLQIVAFPHRKLSCSAWFSGICLAMSSRVFRSQTISLVSATIYDALYGNEDPLKSASCSLVNQDNDLHEVFFLSLQLW